MIDLEKKYIVPYFGLEVPKISIIFFLMMSVFIIGVGFVSGLMATYTIYTVQEPKIYEDMYRMLRFMPEEYKITDIERDKRIGGAGMIVFSVVVDKNIELDTSIDNLLPRNCVLFDKGDGVWGVRIYD